MRTVVPDGRRTILTNVQALRAIAASLVVLFHLKEMVHALGLPPAYFEFAALGVDLFFVISGFIMVHTIDPVRTDGVKFMKNRVARILPLYWVMTFLVFAIALTAPALLKSTAANPLDLIRSLLFIPYARSDGQMMPVLFLGWSLNYEIFFYLILSVALFAGKGRHCFELAIVAILALVASRWMFTSEPGSLLWFYSNPKMLEFVAGMLIGLAYHRLPRIGNWAMCGVAAGFVWLIVTPILFQNTISTLSATGACSLILISSLAGERAGMVADWPVVTTLGDASYSLYLVHPLITQAAIAIWVKFTDGNLHVAAISLVLVPILTMAFAVLTYRQVEMPLSRGMRRVLIPQRQDQVPART